ncbi:hypothetical protein Btru_069181 [Bulinus truncatus]|nr:hypothetical protein Btru_069181 [Bulinus truncatus]
MRSHYELARKAAKAILILVPLFGLQHLLMPFQPEEDTVWQRVYQHVVSLITSLQGAIVSIIFCFCNGEVRSLIVRKWKEQRLMSDHRRKNTATTSTFIDGYSMVDTSRDFTNHKAKNSMDHHNKTNRREFEADITRMGFSWKQLERMAQDGSRWRSLVGGPYSDRSDGQ